MKCNAKGCPGEYVSVFGLFWLRITMFPCWGLIVSNRAWRVICTRFDK